jgi:hypothetical protein
VTRHASSHETIDCGLSAPFRFLGSCVGL